VRVGVVGYGYWGSKHVRVLQQTPGVSSVVVVDPCQDRTAELARSAAAIETFDDLDSALPSVDAVVIAAPPAQHARLAQTALAAGKHVLVEKPMTTTSASGRRLIETAAEHGVTLMVGHTFEYCGAVWKLRELVDSGELGEILHIDAARLNLGLYQQDVNVVWDLAPHDLSIINYILGDRATSVEAWGSSHLATGQEDVAYLRLAYGDRPLRAQVHVSWLDPCKVRRITVVGSQKMAVFDDLDADERLRIYDRGVELEPRPDPQRPAMTYRRGGVEAPMVSLGEPLAEQDRHFLECAQTGRRPRSDGESGLAVVEMLEAATRSMHRGAPVPIAGIRPDWSPATNGVAQPILLTRGA
jgi:predicted dehydrogenase